MSLRIEVSDLAAEDITLQLAWYLRHADADVANRYEAALKATFDNLSTNPGLGRPRRFAHPELAGLHSLTAEQPFDRFVVFYRADGRVLTVVRVIHGMRDLPRRLLDPPGEE
ncbi:MAG: type II toxin-antitoxin system RelE/ParE family toxin [Prosthecobacter sp.]|jgi:toxin ParE1/3/4|uniref:type II toxin-antitoxin system RelE/ParE family toxin n=1 Tax=Prosthecobacter sp. TaxID=1965333 RepID=UPI0019E62E76|nr:type II toxin-antitoxin system RelE/ParE family toxin [Prosthecobacter sp.]MBE2283394.1 type II toxin-antitoxin system RelE/ParE family toxin [Prosthecobacter sp.]